MTPAAKQRRRLPRTTLVREHDTHRLIRPSRGKCGQVTRSCQKKLWETAANTANATAILDGTPAQRTSIVRIAVCTPNPITPTRLNRAHRTPVKSPALEIATEPLTGWQFLLATITR